LCKRVYFFPTFQTLNNKNSNYTHYFNLLWEGYELLVLGNTVQIETLVYRIDRSSRVIKLTIKGITVSAVQIIC
jgi:hypothetical protein